MIKSGAEPGSRGSRGIDSSLHSDDEVDRECGLWAQDAKYLEGIGLVHSVHAKCLQLADASTRHCKAVYENLRACHSPSTSSTSSPAPRPSSPSFPWSEAPSPAAPSSPPRPTAFWEVIPPKTESFYRLHLADARYHGRLGAFRRYQYDPKVGAVRAVVKIRPERGLSGPEKAVSFSSLTPLRAELEKGAAEVRRGVERFCDDAGPLYQADSEMKRLGADLDSFSVKDLSPAQREERRAAERYLERIEEGVSALRRDRGTTCAKR